MRKAILLCMTAFFATSIVYAAPTLLTNLSQWEYNTQYGLHQICCAAMQAYDVDNDGHVDIVIPFRKDTDRVIAVNGQTGAVKWIYPPMDEDGIAGDPIGAPSIADMDGDGNAEVVFMGRNANMYIIDAKTGAGKSITETGGSDEGVCLFDINGDGKLEAIAQADGIVYAVDSGGNKLWQFQMAGGEAHVCPNAFDIDGDTEVDIVCGDGGGNFYAISSTGTEKWRFEAGDKMHHQQAVIADFNSDGDYEIAIHSNDRYLYLLSFWGQELWRFPVGQAYWDVNEDAGKHEGGLAASDLNGDGIIDIVTSDIIGNVHAVTTIEGNAVELWNYKLPDEVWSGIIIGDFDGDMYPEVVVEGESNDTYPDGYTAILDGATGQEDFYFPYWFTAATPSAADFNEDGMVDLVMQAWGEPIHILTAYTPYVEAHWPWRYKYRTASNNGVIPIGDTTWPIPFLEIEWTKSYEEEYGLHQTCCSGLQSCDVDKDGNTDFVIGYRKDTDRVIAVSGQDGSVKWIYPPMDEDGITGDPLGAPAIADMDGDGNAEVVFMGRNANMYIIDAKTGAGKSITETGGADEAVCLYDINGDGKLEAIGQADGIVYAVDSGGNKLWQFQMAGGEAHVAPNAFDIDRDGEVDIVCGDGGGNFYGISSTGAEKWRFEAGDKYHHQQAVIGDFNNDGDYEIAIHSNDRYLYLLSFWGGELWRFPVGQAYWDVNEDAGKHEGGLAAADLDGDGDLEIITSDIIGNVHCVDSSGVEVWHYKCPEEIWTGLIICDFTGDGELNVIACAEGPEEGLYPMGMVAVLSKDGKLEATAPWWYTASTPSVGDFDKDGEIEGVFQAWGEPITVLTAHGAYNADLIPWGYKYKNTANHGVWPLNEGALAMLAIGLLSFVLYRKRR